jgi:hypothetical protein
MGRRAKEMLWGAVAVVVLLATGIKYFINDVGDAFYKAYHRPESISVDDAKRQGILVTRFKIEPSVLSKDGYSYDIGEAWLEAGYRPRHLLIRISYYELADWSSLCIRPRTHWYQNTYSYSLRVNIQGSGLAQTAGNSSPELHFERIPNGLKEFWGTVSVETYGKGMDVTVGTARFTASD